MSNVNALSTCFEKIQDATLIMIVITVVPDKLIIVILENVIVEV